MNRGGRGDDGGEVVDLDFLVHPSESIGYAAGAPGPGRPGVGPRAEPGARSRRTVVVMALLALLGAGAAVNAVRSKHRAGSARDVASNSPVTSATAAPTSSAGRLEVPVSVLPRVQDVQQDLAFIARYPDAALVPGVHIRALTRADGNFSFGFLGDVDHVLSPRELKAGHAYVFSEQFAYGSEASGAPSPPMVLDVAVSRGLLACPTDFVVSSGHLYTLRCTLVPEAGMDALTLTVRSVNGRVGSGSTPISAR